MFKSPPAALIAFSGSNCIASGTPEAVIPELKGFFTEHPERNLVVLDADTSRTIDLDLRASLEHILDPFKSVASDIPKASFENNQTTAKKTRGRPKLGVVSREVTLLPRHWEWLGKQRGGSSVALRKLVESASRKNIDQDLRRVAQDSAYLFMTTMAGDEQGYEEAVRALYANDMAGVEQQTSNWSSSVRNHALALARRAIG